MNMLLKYLKKLWWMLLLAAGTQVQAADIDLFAQLPQTGANAPTVVMAFDNGASFSANAAGQGCSWNADGSIRLNNNTGAIPSALFASAAGVEQCAIYTVIQSLPSSVTGTVKVGIMVFNATGMKTLNTATSTAANLVFADCPGTQATGGCMVLPPILVNDTTKPVILAWLRSWASSGNVGGNIKGNALSNGAIMQETWAYFARKRGLSGTDYSSWAANDACNKYVVFIGNDYRNNTTPADSTTENSSPYKTLAGTSIYPASRASPAPRAELLNPFTGVINAPKGTTICGSTSITLKTSETSGVYALNWAAYMLDQSITTYSVAFLGPTCNDEYAAHLEKLGQVGGGKFFKTTDYQELVDALNSIFSEIQSVNSVFAAVSLPVSVNTQGSFLNQVFVGMFRPDKKSFPRWQGNLKQYKLGLLSGALKLLDADDKSAINNQTGFITECARSFWTPNTVDTYWAADNFVQKSSGCLTVANSAASNYPDGNIVEKGAQAYMVRKTSPASRAMYTCDPTFGSCTSLTQFNTANAAITQALLNPTVGATDRDNLITWARGANVQTDDLTGMATTAMRASVHGDVVHSRPVPVNFGTDLAPSIVVFYGGNDGVLRAVNGSRTATFTVGAKNYSAGDEIWSFMPPEFYGKIKRLYDNTDSISYPGTLDAGATPKDYGFDGPITAFQGKVSGVDKTLLYATMRRGGRAVYGFDVTTPASPSLIWKQGCPNLANDTNCSTGFSGMGQSWSSLKSFTTAGVVTTVPGPTPTVAPTPLVIFGGGYDGCEDYDAGVANGKNHNCAVASTKGNKIYVLNASTGAVVKTFSTDRAVIADVTLVTRADKATVLGYTADLGGNVYRIKFGTGDETTWTITKIASLGCASPAACTDLTANRKFFFAPSVSTSDTIGSTGATYNVALGSGDREKPTIAYPASNSITNYFFVMKDKPDDAAWLNGETATCGAAVICLGSLYGITTSATPTAANLATKPKGWYLGMVSTEQVVTQAITVFGVVTFSTHAPAQPGGDICKNNLGTTRVYNISFIDASSANGTNASRYEDVAGDGLPPSPVAGRVTLDDGTTVPFCIGCSKDSPLEGAPPKSLSSFTQPKGRLYWYIQK